VSSDKSMFVVLQKNTDIRFSHSNTVSYFVTNKFMDDPLWYFTLNPVVGHFGTSCELDSGKGDVTSHFEFMVGWVP